VDFIVPFAVIVVAYDVTLRQFLAAYFAAFGIDA
jgi:hypothetical protein